MTTLDAANPACSMDELAALAQTDFGRKGRLSPRPSERDQNARLTADGRDFVLKIANPAEDRQQIDLQSAVMDHLALVGMPGIPRVAPTTAGRNHAQVVVAGQSAMVRLVSWVDGVPLAETRRSTAQLTALGRYMGRLTQAMQGFGHRAAFRPDFPWSLDRVSGLRDHLTDIADLARRALIAALFDRYETRVLRRLPIPRGSPA